MSVIHLLLNLAALLLWLTAFGPKAEPTTGKPMTLAAQVQPAQVRTQWRWTYLLALAILLLVRAVFYRHLGPSVEWTATWSPGPVTVAFRSDIFSRMALYSIVGFGWTLVVFYSALLLICGLNPRDETEDPITRLMRQHLGPIGRWPRWVQVLLPFLGLTALWWPLSQVFAFAGLLPGQSSTSVLCRQAAIVGLGAWLSWRWTLSVLLVLGFASSYIFFGPHPFWEFVDRTYRHLRRALRWIPLRIGRLDFTAPLLLAVIWGLTWVLWEGVPRSVIARLPALEPWEEPRLRHWYLEAADSSPRGAARDRPGRGP